MKTKAVFCGGLAFLFGIISYFMIRLFDNDHSFLLSILSGLLFYVMLLSFVCLEEKHQQRRYQKAERMILSPIWYQFFGNMQTPHGIKNAKIYFTEGGIVFISLDRKPYLMEELLLSQIKEYQSDGLCRLQILTQENQLFVITAAEIKDLFSLLKEHGWIF